jgi:hypothetical protein
VPSDPLLHAHVLVRLAVEILDLRLLKRARAAVVATDWTPTIVQATARAVHRLVMPPAGARGHRRVALSAGGAVTVAALLLSASGIVATGHPLLLVLFLLGICAFGYAIIATALSTPPPKA